MLERSARCNSLPTLDAIPPRHGKTGTRSIQSTFYRRSNTPSLPVSEDFDFCLAFLTDAPQRYFSPRRSFLVGRPSTLYRKPRPNTRSVCHQINFSPRSSFGDLNTSAQARTSRQKVKRRTALYFAIYQFSTRHDRISVNHS